MRISTEDVEAFIAADEAMLRVEAAAVAFLGGRIESHWEQVADLLLPEDATDDEWDLTNVEYRDIIREIIPRAAGAWSEASGIPYVVEDRVYDILDEAIRKVVKASRGLGA